MLYVVFNFAFLPNLKNILSKNELGICLAICTTYLHLCSTLRPESSENIPILFQGLDLYFPNQNDLRNPKLGSKQLVVVPPTTDFFKKLFFDKKNVEKIGHLVDL